MGSVVVQYCDRCKVETSILKAYRWGLPSQIGANPYDKYPFPEASRQAELCRACIDSTDKTIREFLDVAKKPPEKSKCDKCNGTGGWMCWDCDKCGGHGFVITTKGG